MSRCHALAIFAMLLAGCQGGRRELYIEERETWDGTPFSLDANDVETRAPVLHGLLEAAHTTGSASTQNPEAMDQSLNYLRDVTGVYENVFLLECRGEVFSFGFETWD